MLTGWVAIAVRPVLRSTPSLDGPGRGAGSSIGPQDFMPALSPGGVQDEETLDE